MSQLADPGVLQPLLARFFLRYPGVNRAAVVSQWSMNYMSIVLPATLACVLTRRCAIEFWGEDALLLHDDGQPAALGLAAGLSALDADGRAVYWSRLIHEHLAPLFSTLATAGGLAPKILWGNFVAIWDGAFARMDPDLSKDGFAEAHQWLEQVTVNNGRLKLRDLQRMVESPAPQICPCLPLRRHCCLHYQLHEPVEGQPPVLCESCPKLHRLPLAEQVSYLRYIYEEG
ncbi:MULTISPECIES: siderophore-iron reductase FhuF [unclassified Pseudomonas]|uniref:siderophore-iron reductase FhuF n=1 Tax=unclassified Pseudomonas TaxID=196821 RepID=UPI0016603CAB|nr:MULTISPECIES: siderophore-iron reductase FhuF [unclassified Pseudomonas]MBD0702660.1 siderophore-iron reductase FhuF [Pseudomonas sp. PSB1]WNZ76299.1 siderophore-iron reductase FhuF [Pseudomonas sp. P105]